MPLEDGISQQGAKQNDGLQNFLDSAQDALAEAVAKNAAEKVVDGMFSPGKHANRGGIPSDGPPQEGIYPDLDRGNNQNRESSFMDNAQNAFADAFAKRAAEKLVDGILPSNNTKQPEGNYVPPPQAARPQGSDSGLDLGSLGSSLLESFTDQVLHPSDKQTPQNQRHTQQQAQGQSGFDLGSVGSELFSSLADQVLHPNKTSQDQQQQTSARQPQAQSDNQSGFDLGKVGSELLGSLAEQVMHSSDKKAVEQPQPPANEDDNQSGFDISKVLGSLAEQVLHPSDKKAVEQPQPPVNQDNNQSGFDISKVLGSLAEQVLHPSDKKENIPIQQQPIGHHGNPNPNQTGGDIGSILGSLAENVLGGVKQQYQGPNNYGPFPQGPGPQWYGPGPQGYRIGPQGYGPGPQGYDPGPQGYGPGPQGYGPGPQGYGPGPQGYGPGPQGYWPGPPPQGYGPPHHGYWPDSQRVDSGQQNPKDEQSTGNIGSLLLNSVADAVKQNPASHQNMPMPHLPATALSYGPDNGLYPNLDDQFNSGPKIHPPQPGLHPGGVIPPMPSSTSSNHPPYGGMVPPTHVTQGMPLASVPSSISSSCPTPGYPDSAHAPFPAHPAGSPHHNSGHHPFPDAHGILSKRDLKKISKAEYKMEKEIYKAQKKAEKKAYKAQKKALKKQGYCSHCNHRGSCSCSSSSSSD